jgi:transcriptional regulator with XRE-family HTH domain
MSKNRFTAFWLVNTSKMGLNVTGFAQRLKELRAGANLTQAQLADKSGVSLGGLRDLEQGNRRPLLETAVKLAAALGVDCTAFQATLKQPGGAAEKERVTQRIDWLAARVRFIPGAGL